MLALSRPLFRYLLPLWFSRFTLGDDYSFSSSFFDTRSIYNTHTHPIYTKHLFRRLLLFFYVPFESLFLFSHHHTDANNIHSTHSLYTH